MRGAKLIQNNSNFLLLAWQLGKRTLSWWFPGLPSGATCRFSPTCSQYAHQAIKRYGMIQGCWLSARRILRCHPLNQGGLDPVEKHD